MKYFKQTKTLNYYPRKKLLKLLSSVANNAFPEFPSTFSCYEFIVYDNEIFFSYVQALRDSRDTHISVDLTLSTKYIDKNVLDIIKTLYRYYIYKEVFEDEDMDMLKTWFEELNSTILKLIDKESEF